MFAVKAFKSAMFGTPAPPATVRNTTKQPKKDDGATANARPANDAEDGTLTLELKRAELAVSPAKGILLTPGTTATRKKNVSFSGVTAKHHDVMNQSDDDVVIVENERRPTGAVQTDVRRRLFQNGPESPTPSQAADNPTAALSSSPEPPPKDQAPTKKAPPQRARQQPLQAQSKMDAEPQQDVTVDLKQPRSKSGKHWMQEYQREHDSSKVELKNLIRHNQITKSFAEKRDQEATEFAGKLHEAEDKLREMEQRVSGLASQLMDTQTREDQQAEILNELATQTAQALRYKQKAERYRAALWGEEEQRARDMQKAQDPSKCLNAAKSEEVSTLRSELLSARTAQKEAQKRASDLVLENASLKESLVKVEKAMQQLRMQESLWQKQKDENETAKCLQLKDELTRSREANQELRRRLRDHEKKHDMPSPPKGERPRTKSARMESPEHSEHLMQDRHAKSAMDLRSSSKRRKTDDSLTRLTGESTEWAPGKQTWAASAALPRHELSGLGASRKAPATTARTSLPSNYQKPSVADDTVAGEPSLRIAIEAAAARARDRHRPPPPPAHVQSDFGRRSPIIPPSARRSQELRPSRSTSSLVREQPPRDAGPGLATAAGNARAGGSTNRLGRPGLSEDRIAAAKQRLEEKAAARRASQGNGKENIRPTLPAASALSALEGELGRMGHRVRDL